MQGLASGFRRAAQAYWRAAVLGLLTIAIVLLGSIPAAAQEKDELARRHFESGAAYFAEAEYEEALKAFKKAYELSNRPQILLNISIVEERLGHLQEAVRALDEYMAKNPSDPELETIRLRRDNLAERLSKQHEQAVEQPVEPPHPPARQSAPPPAEEPPPPPTTSESSAPDQTLAYVAFGVGGLAGLGALVTGLMAQSEYDDLEQSCGGACTDDETSGGEALALTSTVLTGLAIVGVGAGFVLWNSADSEQPAVASSQASLGFEVTAEGATARALVRF